MKPTQLAGETAVPSRTWWPMALWTAGILLTVGLAWFVGAVAWPAYQVKRLASEYDTQRNLSPAQCVERLGGEKAALYKLRVSLGMPGFLSAPRATLVQFLGACGDEALPDTIALLHEPDEMARAFATENLAHFRGQERVTVPHLLAALRDRHWSVRSSAAMAFGIMEPPPVDAVPALIRALDDESENVRGWAAFALGHMGPPAGAAAPALFRNLASPDTQTRIHTIWAIGGIRANTKLSVAKLTAVLSDPDKEVRKAAADTLGRIGPAAKETVPGIEKLLLDEDTFVRNAAADALKKIRGESASLKCHIDRVEMSGLPDALKRSTLSDAEKRFIIANVNPDIYPYVTVKMYTKDGEQILEIDQFKYDEWVHSVTGERGKSPHGTRTMFRKVGNDWRIRGGANYGG